MAEPEENRGGNPVEEYVAEQGPESVEAPRPRSSGRAITLGGAAPFRPRWSRILVALLGLAAVAAALVTAVLAVLGIVSVLVPLLCLVAAVAAVGGLRALAVRDRRARVDRAFAEAMAPTLGRQEYQEEEPAVVVPPAPVLPQRPTVLFDAEDATPRQASPMALRTAALSSAHGSSVVEVRSEDGARTATDAAPADRTPWAPVEVPRPTYVESAKAERQAPAPLELPEAPKAQTRTPIKVAEAAARRAEAAAEPAEATEAPGRRIDLDNVLQRRRA